MLRFEMTPTKADINSTIQCKSNVRHWNRTSYIKDIIDVRYRIKADYQYFTPGDTTTLICNTKADTIDWNGPAYSDNFDNQYNIANPYGDVSSYKTSSYSSNITTNKAVPHVHRLQLHKFSLIVQNTTEQDEGLYCCDAYYHTEKFRRCILLIKKNRTKADYQYFTPGDTTTLICNTKADTIDWNGPAYSDNFDNQYNITNPYGDVSSYKTSPYSINITTNLAVPHGNRLQLHKFSLIVQNTTEQDEGLYCCDAYYHTETFRRCILLIKKQPPSGLMLCNAINGSTVKYIQNRPVEIKCTENTGYPPSDLSLLRDNTYIRNGTGQISFEMTPTKEDINSTVQCVSRNTYWNRTSFIKVIIDVRYKPEVKFETSTYLKVKEGRRGVVISCSAFGNPQVNKMRMLKEDTEINSVTGHRIRYQFESINRKDTGKYVCMAKNEVGLINDTMRVVVLYPPDVYVYYLSNPNRLRCVPKGNPENYTFGLWEHRSFFGERIRFLNPRNQELVFNETTYQDSGVYVCNVTNEIEDQAGNNFQHGFVSYFARSPPIELTGNNHVQNGTIGKQGQIQFDFVSFFLITCQSLTPMNHPLDSILTTHVITNRKSVIKFHNVPVTVNSSRIMFIFQNVQQKDFQLYRITVCNQYGKHSYEVDFRQVSDKKEVVHLPTVIIISVVGALIVIIMAFLLFFAIRRRRMQPGSRSTEHRVVYEASW